MHMVLHLGKLLAENVFKLLLEEFIVYLWNKYLKNEKLQFPFYVVKFDRSYFD